MELQSYIACISDTLPTFSLAGEVHVPSPNKHFERTPQNRILYIITDGTMQIIEDTKLYTLTAGDIIIFSPENATVVFSQMIMLTIITFIFIGIPCRT